MSKTINPMTCPICGTELTKETRVSLTNGQKEDVLSCPGCGLYTEWWDIDDVELEIGEFSAAYKHKDSVLSYEIRSAITVLAEYYRSALAGPKTEPWIKTCAACTEFGKSAGACAHCNVSPYAQCGSGSLFRARGSAIKEEMQK